MRALVLAVCLAVVLALPGSAGAAIFTGGTGWFWGNPLPQGEDLGAISFSDASHGVAVGAAGAALRTDDGGATWTGGRRAPT
jgi:photosystem II stability/assembly factor-like uncharacterized protein